MISSALTRLFSPVTGNLRTCIIALSLLIGIAGCQVNPTAQVSSPSGKITVNVSVKNGVPAYEVTFKGEPLINRSRLGYKFRNMPDLDGSFALTRTKTSTHDNTWNPIWGQQDSIRNHYNELTLTLNETESPNRTLKLKFRVFNDGVGFRYVLPETADRDSVIITRELTQFALADSATAWWIPANYDSYEDLYRTTNLSAIDSVNTPITMKTENGVYLSLHEADLTNYAGMTLFRPDTLGHTLQSRLVPWPDGAKVKATLPLKSPWRTIQIATRPGGLIESDMIVNLNDPNKIEDTSWIQPMNYIGIWWHMHIRTHTWWPGKRHGATTERTKKYIDFAANHNIGGVLVEGWNIGWGRNEKMNFYTPYDDYNLSELAKYARKKGVHLIAHNETYGNIPNYERQIDSAFSLYESLDIHAVKTGYAGQIVPEGMHHHGQWMVNHYRSVVKKAAEHEIMVNAHEPIKPTGIRRTWPNMMTREGVRGMEFNAWSSGNPPEHTTILPFTRMLAGPLDYTPGIFDVNLSNFREQRHVGKKLIKKTRVHTTRAKQLALYPILFSPLQMASDLIQNYRGEPAFTFIENVPSSWHETIVLNGEIGDYVTITRRHGSDWYLGSITDKKSRSFKVGLDFLASDTQYHAIRYADAKGTDWKNKPEDVAIDTLQVDANTNLKIDLPSGGGTAIHFKPAR